MKTIAVANLKGGSGKTTTTGTVAAVIGEKRRVVVIDCDLSQANLSAILGVKDDGRMLSAMFNSGKTPTPKTSTWGVDVIPCSPACARMEATRDAGMLERFKKAVRGLRYDVCLIDTGPNLGVATVGALMAADGVVIPVVPTALDAIGVARMIEAAKELRVPVLGVAVVKGRKTGHAAAVLEKLRHDYGKTVLQTVIPLAVSVEDATSHQLPVTVFRKLSKPAEAYRALAREIERRLTT